MPICKYRCGLCRGEYEFLQRDYDSAHQRCPECTGPLVIVASKANAHKGFGWYVTDYKNAGHTQKCEDVDNIVWQEHQINLIHEDSQD